MDCVTTKRAAAEFFGVSVQALDGWFSSGCPVERRDNAGHIAAVDVSEMARWRIARSDDGSEDGGSLDRERTRLTKAQADRTELEVAELRGELVRAPVIGAHWQAMVAAMRARLLSLPATIATKVAGPDSIVRTQDLIQAIVYEALAEVGGDGFPDDVRRRIGMLSTSGDGYAAREAAAEADDQRVGERIPAAKRGRQRRAGSVSE